MEKTIIIFIAAVLVLGAGVFYAAMVVSGKQDDTWPADDRGTYDQYCKSGHPDYCPAADSSGSNSVLDLGGAE